MKNIGLKIYTTFDIQRFIERKKTGWFCPNRDMVIKGINVSAGDYFYLNEGKLSCSKHPSLFKTSLKGEVQIRHAFYFFNEVIHRGDGPAILSFPISTTRSSSNIDALVEDLESFEDDQLGDSFWIEGEQVLSTDDILFSFSNMQDIILDFKRSFLKKEIFNKI